MIKREDRKKLVALKAFILNPDWEDLTKARLEQYLRAALGREPRPEERRFVRTAVAGGMGKAWEDPPQHLRLREIPVAERRVAP